MGYIYCITNTLNGKQYVGQTTQSVSRRWNQHCNYGSALYKAIKKHGAHNFNICVLFQTDNRDELNAAEARLIGEIGSLSPNGYNLTSGGDSYVLSSETKRKISESSKGKKMSKESKIKMSLKKRKLLGDLNPFFGKTHSERTKSVNSKKHRLPIQCVETGTVFDSAKQASEKLKINHSNITQVLKNKRKSAGGFTFRYANGENLCR